jgi:hypothetical protein
VRYSADICYIDWQDPQLNTATACWGFYQSDSINSVTDTSIFENYYGNNQRQYIATPRTIGLALKYNF